MMTIDKVLSMDSFGDFKDGLEQLSDEEMKVFVPDVYQKDIYLIDYDRLWKNGVRLVTFDLDDTVGDMVGNAAAGNMSGFEFKLPKAKQLVSNLKSKGFKVAILTNANRNTAEAACREIGADYFHYKADKPAREGFELMLQRFGLEPSQMAHIGDSIKTDVAGGNRVGVTTCLVRRKGIMSEVLKAPAKVMRHTRDQAAYRELEKRGMWSRHHVISSGDQYYQLGEAQKFMREYTVKAGRPGMKSPMLIGLFIDGKSPYKAALNLRAMLEEDGEFKVIILNSREEVDMFPGKVIVMGHHKDSKEILKTLGEENVRYEEEAFGLKFACDSKICVLYADRDALRSIKGGAGRDMFEAYYNETAFKYMKGLEAHHILNLNWYEKLRSTALRSAEELEAHHILNWYKKGKTPTHEYQYHYLVIQFWLNPASYEFLDDDELEDDGE